jgi:hypothetical protein
MTLTGRSMAHYQRSKRRRKSVESEQKFCYHEIQIKIVSSQCISPDTLDTLEDISELVYESDFSKGDFFVLVHDKEISQEEAQKTLEEIQYSLDDILFEDEEDEKEDEDGLKLII